MLINPNHDPELKPEWDEEGQLHWWCTRCKELDFCVCIGGMVDPICECGHLAFTCDQNYHDMLEEYQND